jgi:hypothetical protein
MTRPAAPPGLPPRPWSLLRWSLWLVCGAVILLWAASPWWWPDLFRLLQSSIQRSYGYGLFEAPWYLRSDHQIHVLTTCVLTL